MFADHFLLELSTSMLILRETACRDVEQQINRVLQSTLTERKLPSFLSLGSNINLSDEFENPFDAYEEGSIIVIPIIGTMLKYGSWWTYGMDEMANFIRLADASSKVAGTILLSNTPGGTTQSVIQLEDALRQRTKPCVGVVDGQCCSGGIYTLSFCDKIVATNRMCEAGSIGTFAQIMDDSAALEKYGYKVKAIYPPESKYKNLEVRKAIEEDDDSLIISERLSPYARHFQDIIKNNRPNLDTTAEGILEGKVFYAYDAIKYGLIDSIMSINEAVKLVSTMAEEKKSIYSQLKF